MTDSFENRRTQNLMSRHILDTIPEKEYDDITSIAAHICNAPFSLISFRCENQRIFRSPYGITIKEIQTYESICSELNRDSHIPLIIEDGREVDRLRNNSHVPEKPAIAFYAGMPLINTEGNCIGTLCVFDTRPHKLEQKQTDILKSLADQAVHLFELHKKRLELKKIGNNLSVETQRLKNIIDATQVGTWEWHIPSGKVTINDRWAEMLGYKREELEPLTIDKFRALVLPEDFETSQKKVEACLEKRSDFYEGNYRFIHKSGQIIWIYHRGQVISWSDQDEPILMAGTNTDITERINTETQFKTITNNIPGTVFRYKRFRNGNDQLQLVSDGAKNLWGFYPQEVMDNNLLIWERYEEEDLGTHFKSIQKSAEDLSFWQHEWRYHHPDGTIRWHKGFGKPSRMDDGSTVWDSVILDYTHEKNNKLELEQSEKRFKALIQDGADLITILNFDGMYTYVSPTSLNILGASPEEFIGKNAFDFVYPDDKEMAHESFMRLKSEKQVFVKPIRFTHGDGSWRWKETVLTNLMDDPAVRGIVSNSRDVTERILTEEKVKKSEAYYRLLYESQTNYVIRTDLNGDYSYVNKKFLKEYGWIYPNNEMVGKSSMISVMEYHHEKVRKTVEKCIAEPEKVFKIEIDKPTRDGKISVTLWDFTCVTDNEGRPIELQCVGMDITDRILSERALKESERRYSDLFHLSPQPMWVYDLDSLKFLDVNKAAIKHYGYSYKEFMAMDIKDIRRQSEIPKLDAVLKHLKENKKEFSSGEYLHLKKSGEEIIVEIQSNNLSYKGRNAKMVLANDITERYKYIEAIETQNIKLKEIAWTQSHIVRAPLARVMGLTDLLKDTPPSDQMEELLNLLHHSATELDEIIKDIVIATRNEESSDDV